MRRFSSGFLLRRCCFLFRDFEFACAGAGFVCDEIFAVVFMAAGGEFAEVAGFHFDQVYGFFAVDGKMAGRFYSQSCQFFAVVYQVV